MLPSPHIPQAERRIIVRKVSMLLPLLLLVALVPSAGLAQSPEGQPVPYVVFDREAGTPSGIDGVLFEQTYDGQGWWASQCFPDLGWCYFTADDFVVEEEWAVDAIFVHGGGAIENADLLNWYVYPDDNGVPAGVPGDGAEFWSLSLPPSAPGVTIADGGTVLVDLVAATGGSAMFPPGHWWMVFFPDMALSPHGQWGWHTGEPNQYHDGVQFIIDPPWEPQGRGYAFRLEGGAGPPPPVFATHMGIINLPGPQLLLGYVRAATGDGSTPVGGAVVDVEWVLPNGTPILQTRTANAQGLAFPVMLGRWPGQYWLFLQFITAPEYEYDPSLNWVSQATITLP
jgi:hypothetical protein